MLAGGRVTRERHAGARFGSFVPEHHLHDVDRRAEVVRNVIGAAIDLCARRVPGVEDGPDRSSQLLARVLREPASGLLAVHVFVGLDQLREVVVRELDVLLHATRVLQIGQRLLEAVCVDAIHDLAVHLDETPVGVARKTRIAGAAGEAFDGVVVQPEVEDRVHHPRHRDRGT